jgi:hypothetical protein
MGCSTCNSKITDFFNRAKELRATKSYELTQAVGVGNTKKAKCSERDLENIRSMSWLLSKHQQGLEKACLCDGAGPFKMEEELIESSSLPDPDTNPQFEELFRGVLYNPKLGKLVSLTSFRREDADPNYHTGIRIRSWEGAESTIIYEEDNLIEIELPSWVSFYYSELHDSYFLRTGTRIADPMDNTLFKVDGGFTSPTISYVTGVKNNNFLDITLAVADEKNLLYLRFDSNVIEIVNIVDLTNVAVINTTGFPYQKMTWNPCECNLILTGNNLGSAQIHYVDVDNYTVTNKLSDASIINNTSIILNDGSLLVLTSGPSLTVQFQKWSSCANGSLLETIETNLATSTDFFNLLNLQEDEFGNIYLTHINGSTKVQLSVFNSSGEVIYTKEIPTTPNLNFQPFTSSLVPDWNNSFISPSDNTLILNAHHRNGVGGNGLFYLKQRKLLQAKAKCISLTEEEICDLIEKIKRI